MKIFYKGTLLIEPSQANLLKTNTHIVLKSRKLDLGDIANPQKFFRGDYFEIIPGSGESKTRNSKSFEKMSCYSKHRIPWF